MDKSIRDFAIILGLIAAYLIGSTSLALTVDRGFFLNDWVAIAIWLVFGIALLIGGRSVSSR